MIVLWFRFRIAYWRNSKQSNYTNWSDVSEASSLARQGDFIAKSTSHCDVLFAGTPERIRTAGLPLRRRTLYPAELQARIYIESTE